MIIFYFISLLVGVVYTMGWGENGFIYAKKKEDHEYPPLIQKNIDNPHIWETYQSIAANVLAMLLAIGAIKATYGWGYEMIILAPIMMKTTTWQFNWFGQGMINLGSKRNFIDLTEDKKTEFIIWQNEDGSKKYGFWYPRVTRGWGRVVIGTLCVGLNLFLYNWYFVAKELINNII